MRFGLSLVVGGGADNDYTLKRAIDERLEMARTAQAAGFEVASTGQHFGQATGAVLAQPMPLLARMAADVPGMTLQTGVLLGPFYHPVVLAEEMAALHAITDGHFQAAIGLGYRDTEFAMFGQSRKERLPRTVELIGIVRDLLAGKTVTHEGRFFNLTDVSLGDRAVEQPPPKVLIGASALPGVERSARIADGVYLDGHRLKSEVAEYIEIYRQELAASGNPGEFSLRRELRLGNSRTEVLDAGRAAWARGMDDYASHQLEGPLQWIGDELRSGGYSRELPFIVGTPEECAEELDEYARMGVETMILRIQVAGVGHAEAMRGIERFGAEVLPLVRGASAA
jgi:alkanesulfonate monooxygenase SsuD/methylene tetrahydromethanopterin reductase-like flavin-dependent oxidoreductase (luciferase family)